MKTQVYQILNILKGKLGDIIFGPYGRVNHKIFVVLMEYLIIKHLEIDKKKRNEFKDTEEMNITLHKKCKWPVNP